MSTRDIEVGKIGAVGLVDVIVAFEQWGAGGDDDGLEEGGGAMCASFGESQLGKIAVEESDL